MARQAVPENKPAIFDEAMTMTGFGIYNICIMLIAGGGLTCAIIETQSMMFIIPVAQCDLQLSLEIKGLLYSVSFLGVVCSSYFWGFIADTKGRRKVLVISLFASAATTLISSMVPSAWLFVVLRFLNGFLIGGSSAINYAYAGEFHTDKLRPRVVTCVGFFFALGTLVLPAMAWLILPMKWSYYIPLLGIVLKPWRLLMVLNAVVGLTCGILMFFAPESPKYLLTQNKNDEALKILRSMFRWNTGKNKEKFAVSEILWSENVNIEHHAEEGILTSMWHQTKPLFEKSNWEKTLLICAFQYGSFISNNSVLLWLPEILNALSIYGKEVPASEVGICNSFQFYINRNPNHENVTEGSLAYEFSPAEASQNSTCIVELNTEVYVVSLSVGVASSLTYMAVSSIIGIIGKKTIVLGFLLMGGVAILMVQIINGYYYMFVFLGAFFMTSVGIGVVNAIVVDLYPTQVRAMALTISLMFGRLGAMTGSNIAGPLIHLYCDYFFYMIAGVYVVLIIILILLPCDQKKEPPQLPHKIVKR